MFKITKEINFCYGHRLLNYAGKCRHLHGHNGRVEIDLRGKELDAHGMLWDFGDIKALIQSWLEEELDHHMILHRHDPLVSVLQSSGEPLFLLNENPTAENLAKLIYERAQAFNLPIAEVRFWETPASMAAYHG